MTVDTPRISYKNKIILAPMVRVGTLPMRLLALRNGADIVYSEELIDLKMIKTKRRLNDVLSTVDFVDPSDGTVVFRTCDEEKGKVVIQLGTNDAHRALAVGKLVEKDVAGIDINMGCPKEFSIKGGMGAALLAQPNKASEILRTLSENLSVPITCKIRILPTIEATINLVQGFATTGIVAIAIHARTRDERPQDELHHEFIQEVAKAVNIPVIANGGSRDIVKFSDILKFKEKCGADSVMVARASQFNVSIFRKQGLLPIDFVIKEYLKLCVDYDNAAHNTKYCIQGMLRELQESPTGKRFLLCQTLHQICEIWDLGDYCRAKQIEYHRRGIFGRREVKPGFIPNDHIGTAPHIKRMKSDNSSGENSNEQKDVIESNIAFFRSNYTSDTKLPKTMLYTYAMRHGKDNPVYVTQRIDKLFQAICYFDEKKYASSFWEKNKKQAEQAAALACLLHIGQVSETELIQNGSVLR